MPPPKKKSLDLLIAVGKGGAKPSGDMPSDDPMGGDEMMPPEDGATSNAGADDMDGDENCIALPPGFKAPDGSEDGKPFTTTIRGKIMDGKFYAEAIGDMPLDGKGAEAPQAEEETDTSMDAPASDYAAKKADSMAAKAAFQS